MTVLDLDGWRSGQLGEFIELKRGYDLPGRDRRDGPVPIISSSGPSGWHSEAMAKAPGVVTGRYGTIGQVFFVERDFWPLNTALYVRAFKGNDPRFVSYFLRSVDFDKYCDKAAVPGVNRNHLHMEQVRFPPVPDQRQIAAILGAIDDKIELNRSMNLTLEEMAKAVFKSWFIDFDGNEDLVQDDVGSLPRGWRRASLVEFAREGKHATTAGPFGSKLTSKHYSADGVPVLRGVNLSPPLGWFHDDDFVFVSEDYAVELTGNMAFPGDVVFTQRGTLGQVGVIPSSARYGRYVISQSQMKLTCAPWVPPAFIYLFFRQASTIEHIRSNAVAAGVPHINLGFLRDFPMVMPDRTTLARFASFLEPIQTRIELNAGEARTLTTLRDTLLPKLISGELRVRPAEGGAC
ncbi:MAG: restriction endonuclease subunit S [Pseudomonadota bacterium]|nr:restriction endonuclease subunit S [Pseudomonadota bacterium]